MLFLPRKSCLSLITLDSRMVMLTLCLHHTVSLLPSVTLHCPGTNARPILHYTPADTVTLCVLHSKWWPPCILWAFSDPVNALLMTLNILKHLCIPVKWHTDLSLVTSSVLRKVLGPQWHWKLFVRWANNCMAWAEQRTQHSSRHPLKTRGTVNSPLQIQEGGNLKGAIEKNKKSK